MKTSIVLTLAASLAFFGCDVEEPPVATGSSSTTSTSSGYATCELEEQDDASCSACLESQPPVGMSADGQLFESCYEKKSSGALEGDGSKCASAHSAGAEEWKSFVAGLCSTCSASCCSFCSSPYGVLEP